MRCLVLFASVLLCLPAAAVTRNDDHKSPGPPLSREEIQDFALQLKTVAELVSKQYTRPVPRPAVLAAALKGLYETAAIPIPSGLDAELKKVDDADNKLVKLLMRTRQRLGNPSSLRGARALEISLRAALQSLDRYCFLTTSDAYHATHTKDKDGVGLELETNVVAGPLRVKAVLPGSPAQIAGVRPGDQITEMNGQSLQGKKAVLSEAVWRRLAEGSKNQSFRITILRTGQKKPRRITLAPRSFRAETVFGVNRGIDNSWNYFVDRKEKIAHIRVGTLKQGTAADLQEVLDKLQKAGMRGLVLDLRWCPGGLLDEAVDVASLFVGDRTIATINYRDGRKQTCSRRKLGLNGVEATASFLEFPLVVLINGETQGGGELIAAAIQDTKRGAIAGQRTIGKGSVQNALMNEQREIFQTVSNLTIRLSIGVFTRSSGKNLQRFADSKAGDDWGVRPDPRLEFAVSAELSRHLGDLWSLQNLRPGKSNEQLPMDDPANDAQREFAVRTLVKMLNKAKGAK
jgi:carboxyl-terminal processing protease